MVSLVVFALVMTAMGSAFYKTYKDWQRQRDYNLVFENARWAMEFMSNEIRTAADDDIKDNAEGPLANHELLYFNVSLSGSGTANDRIYYFRGDSSFGASPYVLYRSAVGKNDDLDDAKPLRKELCRFVVDGTDIYNVSSCTGNNCTVAINLTVRPRPDQPERPGNRNYSFRAKIRPRN